MMTDIVSTAESLKRNRQGIMSSVRREECL